MKRLALALLAIGALSLKRWQLLSLGIVAATAFVVRERFVPVDGCLRGSPFVSITVPYRAGSSAARATWARTSAKESVSDADLLRVSPAPADPRPPAATVEESDEAPGPTWTIIGASSSVGFGALAGLFVGSLWMPRSSSIGERLYIGSGWGAVGGILAALPALGLGFAADASATAEFVDAQKETQRYRAEKRAHAAWARRVDEERATREGSGT